MALDLVTDQGTIFLPGAYVSTTVQATAGGLGTTGVIALVGEASSGLSFDQESDLAGNCSFGPDQYADVVAKYGSGPLVDAFVGAVHAANDDEIQGSPAQIVLVKTNQSGAASTTLPNYAATTWATLSAKVPGADGSLYSRTVTAATTEVVPTTGAFTFIPPIAATDIEFRVNGGSSVAYTITALQTPAAFVSGVDALSGVAATGGADRGIIGSVTGTLAVAVVSGNQITLTRSVAWTVTPSIGDTLFISATSAVKGGSNQNVGSYVVQAATSTVITATKLLDGTGAYNALTTPVAVSAVSIASTTADAQCFAPVTISVEAGNPIDGVGKSLTIAELTTNTGRLSVNAYQLNTTPVTWVSKSGAPAVLTSATEYSASLVVARAKDGISETITAGGPVALTLSYTGTSGQAVIANNVMTITVVGGTGSNLGALNLTNFATIADLAAYINAQTGYAAAVGNATLGQALSTTLDSGTFNIGSTFGALTGRIKQDAYAMKAAIAPSSNVKLTGTLPTAGLPAPAATVFLSGGTRGGSTDTQINNAYVALEGVDCNFVVPLFSCDAGTDISDGLTDSSSTYTIAATNANLRSHVLGMYTLQKYSPRQGAASFRGTFADAQAAASNMASGFVAMTFQDVRTTAGGAVVQERPWMAAVKACGMQAAAFRKSIFAKGVDIVGAVQAAADMNPRKASEATKAIRAGLMTLRPRTSGGWEFITDQTTYTKDDNFYFNSFQAVYGGNIIARTLKQRLELAIVGQSVVDMGRSQVLAVLRAILDDLRDTAKLIAKSDDAPLGYKNEDAKVTPPTVNITVEAKESTSLYFVRVNLAISAVSQTG